MGTHTVAARTRPSVFDADDVQVLFNAQPPSYTRACTTSSTSDIEQNVTPPGVTVPSGATLPKLVSERDART